MKRTVALLVALFLTFGLASCNRPPQPPSASSGGPATSAATSGAASSTLSTTDTTTTASTTTTAVTTTKRPSVTVPPVKKPGKTSPAKKPTVPVTKPASLPTALPTAPSSPGPETSQEPEESGPSIADAYNIYLYALYTTYSQDNVATQNNTSLKLTTPDSHFERYDVDAHASWMGDTFSLEHSQSADIKATGSFSYQRMYFDGSHLYLRDGRDYEEGMNIGFACSQEELFENFLREDPDSTLERFKETDVKDVSFWQAGGSTLGIKFTVDPANMLEDMQREARLFTGREDLTLVSPKSYTCDVYISTYNYRLECFEIWGEYLYKVGNASCPFSYQLCTLYEPGGYIITAPYWIADTLTPRPE